MATTTTPFKSGFWAAVGVLAALMLVGFVLSGGRR